MDAHTEATQTPAMPYEYEPSIEDYLVSSKEYLQKNKQYDVLCVGVAVFNEEGKLLLVRRANSEVAFPGAWVGDGLLMRRITARGGCHLLTSIPQEIPGGKVDEPDQTMVHGAVRELKEEAGLDVTRVVRKVGSFCFATGRHRWIKHIFEMEVRDAGDVVLDPLEHDDYVWATEEEVMAEQAGEVRLRYVSEDNKKIKLDAFRHRRCV